jgi:hypothetical protein
MKTKIVLIASILLIISSCKKEATSTPAVSRLTPQNNSGIWGTVTFIEKASLSQTEVDIEVNNANLYTYVAHIHTGTPTDYHGAVYIFQPMLASSGHLSYQQNISLLYDSAIVYNGTFVLHDSTANNVLGLCGIGANK